MSYKNAIHLQNISKTYNIYEKPIDRLLQMLPWNKKRSLGKSFDALKSIDLEVKKGEVVGIIGQNGAGKSSLLQIICSILEPSSGQININGKIAALLELGSGFNPEFSGKDNIYLSGAIAGLSKEEIDNLYNEIVAFSGIGDHVNNLVKTYSSGMMVRLAFAVATSIKPEILIIDEALSVGDGAFARKSFDRIMELKESGCTILFCSHGLYQVEVLCNKVMWIDKGAIQAYGDPANVIQKYQKHLDGLNCGEDKKEPKEKTFEIKKESFLRIEKVTILVDGEKTDSILTSDVSTLTIDVSFNANFFLPTPTIGIVITDDKLKQITSCSTFFDKFDIKIDGNAKGKVSLSFPKIGLRKGNYIIEVYLMCEKGIHIYDTVQSSYFEIIQEGSEPGIVSLPRVWNDG